MPRPRPHKSAVVFSCPMCGETHTIFCEQDGQGTVRCHHTRPASVIQATLALTIQPAEEAACPGTANDTP